MAKTGICPCFKLDFLKIEFQWKTRFAKNRFIGNQTLKKKSWNSSFMQDFSNSIFGKSSFSLKLDFLKIEFQNKGISLNSFKHEAFCWKFSAKGVFCHFGLNNTKSSLIKKKKNLWKACKEFALHCNPINVIGLTLSEVSWFKLL